MLPYFSAISTASEMLLMNFVMNVIVILSLYHDLPFFLTQGQSTNLLEVLHVKLWEILKGISKSIIDPDNTLLCNSKYERVKSAKFS